MCLGKKCDQNIDLSNNYNKLNMCIRTVLNIDLFFYFIFYFFLQCQPEIILFL